MRYAAQMLFLAVWLAGAGQTSFAHDLSSEEVSLAMLMLRSDLVVVGRLVTVPVDRAGHHVSTVEITRILASVWSKADVLTAGRVANNEGVITVALLVQLPFTDPPSDQQVVLDRGGDYLLWLRASDVSPEDAETIGVHPSTCYEVVKGSKSAILLSDPTKLEHYAHLKEVLGDDFDPEARRRDFLQNTFKVENPGELLEAVKLFAALMKAGGRERDKAARKARLEELASSEEYIYSSTATALVHVSAAAELVESPDIGRFRYVETTEPGARPGNEKVDAADGDDD